MNLKRLGLLMSHWHSSMGDPVYAAGSYFISGEKYPDLSVVESALENIQKDIDAFPRKGKSYGWTEADLTELFEIRDSLRRYIKEQSSEDLDFGVTVCVAFAIGVEGGLFYNAWADWAEEHGMYLLRCAIENVAPSPPKEVAKAVKEWIGQFKKLNGFDVVEAYKRACVADNLSPDLLRTNYAEDLGSSLVMQGLGHGVGWTDDHKPFDVKFPHVQASVYTNTKKCKNGPENCCCKIGFDYNIGGSITFRG